MQWSMTLIACCLMPAWGTPQALAAQGRISLSAEHEAAVNRPRRIVRQYDAADHRNLKLPPKEWLAYVFDYVDQPGSQIDCITWDIGLVDAVYPSTVFPATKDKKIVQWRADGFDWVGALVEECKKRNLEVFWNHRISEVDIRPEGGLEMRVKHPLKAANPHWLIRNWWWQGLWNLAVPEVHDYKLRMLRELAENYDFDGIQIDLARHVPVLPPGRQWEEREMLTQFFRKVRRMLLEVEKKRGRAFLLAAKVAATLEGCRIDGFDVETWARERLIDVFSVGSRSSEVDLAGYRRITTGTSIKLHPVFDDHHTTDGYRFPPIEYLRGVFSNWWAQGADAVQTFNWSAARPEVAAPVDGWIGPASHGQAYKEAGSPETMRFKDKLFTVQWRGGYPWADGFFNRNDWAPLPHLLSNDGRISGFRIRVGDDLSATADRSAEVSLRVVLFNADPSDRLEVKLNGKLLGDEKRDSTWKDPQIFSPAPQPNSGGEGDYKVDPNQKLLLLVFPVQPQDVRFALNDISLRVVDRQPYRPGADIKIEKIELKLGARRR